MLTITTRDALETVLAYADEIRNLRLAQKELVTAAEDILAAHSAPKWCDCAGCHNLRLAIRRARGEE